MATFTNLGTNDFDLKSKLTVEGSTDTVTECLCCGKKNLKGTVVLRDEWGNYSFFGSMCAKNALNIWSKSTGYQKTVEKSFKRKFVAPKADIYTTIQGIEFKLTHDNKEDYATSYKKVKGEWVWDKNKVGIQLAIMDAINDNIQNVSNIDEVAEWLEANTNFKFPF